MRLWLARLARHIASRLDPQPPLREWEITSAETKTTYAPTVVGWKVARS